MFLFLISEGGIDVSMSVCVNVFAVTPLWPEVEVPIICY